MGRPRVYVSEVFDVAGESHRRLESAGVEVILGRFTWDEPTRAFTQGELIDSCRDVDAVMGGSRERYTRELFEACPRLRIVSKYGIGTEKIDVAAATELGLLVGHTPVRENYREVSEHTLALMLASLRRISEIDRHVRSGGWRGPDTPVRTLDGCVVGLIGLGRIGQAVARRLQSWEVEVIACDPFAQAATAVAVGASLVGFEDLLARSDVISLHVVLTPETHRILDARAFAAVREGVVIVNTSRGEAIDEAALVEALRTGRVSSAALDVFDPEPPAADNPLLSMPGVILSPHVATFSPTSIEAIFNAGADNLLAALRGDLPPYLKNPHAESRWRQRFPVAAV